MKKICICLFAAAALLGAGCEDNVPEPGTMEVPVESVTLDEVLCDMRKRDKNDSTRAAAPCVPAKDAVLFDNSDLDAEQTVEKALEIIYGKLGKTE